ncbi:unnamed protein product, partial [marine sediment metagenome]
DGKSKSCGCLRREKTIERNKEGNSEETRQKISVANKGRVGWMLGVKGKNHPGYKHGLVGTKGYNCAQAMKHKAAKLQQTLPWADQDAILLYYVWRDIWNMILSPYLVFEVDHIIPLQGENVRGLHVENNLQLLPLGKNRSKGNRI